MDEYETRPPRGGTGRSGRSTARTGVGCTIIGWIVVGVGLAPLLYIQTSSATVLWVFVGVIALCAAITSAIGVLQSGTSGPGATAAGIVAGVTVAVAIPLVGYALFYAACMCIAQGYR